MSDFGPYIAIMIILSPAWGGGFLLGLALQSCRCVKTPPFIWAMVVFFNAFWIYLGAAFVSEKFPSILNPLEAS